MKKYRVIFLYLALSLNAISQYAPQRKIDSLIKVLPSLNDTARIDCLNALSIEYVPADKKNSAYYYAALANTEAKKINYLHGLAASYYCQSQIVWHFSDDFIQSEVLAREALKWYEKTSNKREIADLYNVLAILLLAQSQYNESVEFSKKAYEFAAKSQDIINMTHSLRNTGFAYKEAGEYEKAFYFLQKEYQMQLETKDQTMIAISLFGLGELYMLTGDYYSALIYFRKAFIKENIKSQESMKKSGLDIWVKMEFAEIFSHLGLHDSAWHYFNLFKPSEEMSHYNRIYLVSTGECHFLQKNYHQALENFLAALPEHEKLNDRNEVMRTLIKISKASLELNKNSMGLQYAQKGLNMALMNRAKQQIRDAYQILYLIYDKRGIKDSANYYFRQYKNMNDTVVNEQIRANLAAQAYNEKIAMLNKEKELRQQKLEQSALQKKLLIFALVCVLLFGFILFRNIILKRKNEAHRREIAENELQLQKLKSEKKQEELEYKATELEMQALRAQMNPHFIFNCLSSINRFILKNESESASDYLTKFSRLIRMVLTNSKKEWITLDDELEMLRLYLEMERLRFKYSFDYNISFKNEIDAENILIPPLLLQPFAENAIWHGLMNKEGQGHLTILLSKENNILSCIIEDNGVGRKKAAELKSKSAEKKKSFGLQITKERLALLNGDTNETTFFEVEDLYDDKGNAIGTRVILKIRLSERFEKHSLIS